MGISKRPFSAKGSLVSIAGASVGVLLLCLLIWLTVGRGETSTGPAASTPAVVPWLSVAAPAAATDSVEQPCLASQLKFATGHHGAWHGMTSQQIDVTNVSPLACRLLGDATKVNLLDASGTQIPADDSPIANQELTLEAGDTAWVSVATAASCADYLNGPPIVKDLSVVFTGGAPVTLDDAWLATGCGQPKIFDMQTDPANSNRAQLPLMATIADLGDAHPGATLTYVVILQNSGTETVPLEPCPAYDEALKGSAAEGTFLLNCRGIDGIAPGASISFDMRLEVPDNVQADLLLTWDLRDHPEVLTSSQVKVS